jgi:hypothetical protein
MTAKVFRPFKVMAFNVNLICWQGYELSKQLQDSHIDVLLLSEAHLKPHKRLFIPNCHFYWTGRFLWTNGSTASAVRKGIPHTHVDLHPFASVESTGVCILIGNNEVLLAAVYRSPGHTWNDADITELLSFRRKSLLAGDLNAKHPFWNSMISNISAQKLLAYKWIWNSAPQCPTHYSPAGKGSVLHIGLHKNIRLSEVTLSVILDSDHLQIVFYLLIVLD